MSKPTLNAEKPQKNATRFKSTAALRQDSKLTKVSTPLIIVATTTRR
jgi:hypothetical protein